MATKTPTKPKKKTPKVVLPEDKLKPRAKEKRKTMLQELSEAGKIKQGKDFGLNLKQSFFCELYATTEEFFGNGVQSYIEAYDPPRRGNWYNSARSSAYENLTKPDILRYIDYLLELRGLNDQYVDKQLEILITQNADYKSKLGGIKEYNVLKKRTTKKELDITSGGKPITGMQIVKEK